MYSLYGFTFRRKFVNYLFFSSQSVADLNIHDRERDEVRRGPKFWTIENCTCHSPPLSIQLGWNLVRLVARRVPQKVFRISTKVSRLLLLVLRISDDDSCEGFYKYSRRCAPAPCDWSLHATDEPKVKTFCTYIQEARAVKTKSTT